MAITADVLLEVTTTKAERQVKKLEKGVDRIASANEKLLKLDRRILATRKQIRKGSDEAAAAARRRLGILREQRQELVLQKRELNQIAAAESKAASTKGTTTGRKPNVRGAALAGLAPVSIPGQEIIQAGALGAAFAGPKGAAIAAGVATIAKGADALAKFGAASALAAADIAKLRIALEGIAGSGYQDALAAIDRASRDFNSGITETTQQFTSLSAAATASGFTIAEIEQVYRGLAAANKALGGDSQKLQGILLATTQVFSKGKVTAEELRGQIGERLPGAFAAFAEATGRSTAELDKALEKGQVSLRDFVTFTEAQLVKYEEQAKAIGDSPAEAGARLDRALQDLQLTVGPALADLGAKFQDFGTDVVEALDPVIERLMEIFDIGQSGNLDAYGKALTDLAKIDAIIAGKQKAIADAGNQVAAAALRADLESLERRRAVIAQRVQDLARSIPRVEPSASSNRPPRQTTPDTETKTKTRRRTGPTAEEILQAQMAASAQIRQQLERSLDASTTFGTFPKELLQISQELEDTLADIYENADEAEKASLENLARIDAAMKGIGATFDVTKQYMDNLDAAQNLIDDTSAAFKTFFQQQTRVKEELSETEKLLKGSYDIIANRLTSGIEGLIRGTSTLRDIFADIASSLGRMFLNAAFTGLGSALKIPGYADGGLVTRPTLAMVGEGGEPEYVIPQSKMGAAARNYASGERGPSILNDDAGMFNRYSAAGSGAIDITYSVTSINDQHFVTEEQFQAGLQQAAAAGAQRGHGRTMNVLQNSRGQRSRVGM